jgi:hypothetical protein
LTFDQEFYAAVATNTFEENLTVNIKFPLSPINGAILPSGARGAQQLMLGTNNKALTEDPGFVGYSSGNYELNGGLELLNQMPSYKNHNMKEFGPQELSARAITENLKDYVNNLDINKVSKELLLKSLGKVTDALSNEQYKQALLHMAAFLAQAKLQSPWIINEAQFDYILVESVDICKGVFAMAENNSESGSVNKIKQILNFFKSFSDGNDKSGKYKELVEKINELAGLVQ